MSSIIVPQRRVWTQQPQHFHVLAPEVADLNPVGANFATNFSLAGRPLSLTSENTPAVRPNVAGLSYYPGESDVYAAYYADLGVHPLVGEYTFLCVMSGPLYSEHTLLIKGVGGSNGVQFSINTAYSADGSGTLGPIVTHYGVAAYSFASTSFKPKEKPCTLVITGKANDVAKCWINGVYVGSVAVGNLISDTTNPLIFGRPSSDGGKYFYGGYPLFFLASRRASDQLAKRLSVNPWQIFAPQVRRTFVDLGAGGTYSVYSDSSLSYYIRSLLSSDSGISYAIRNAIYRDDAVGYALRSAISSNSEVGYVLRQAIAKDDPEIYLIRGIALADDAETYNIRGLVQTSDSETYSIRSSVQADVSASYDVMSSTVVAANNSVSYYVRGAVSGDGIAGYTVRASVSAGDSATYSVRSAASRDVVAGYEIAAAESSVYADSTVAYSVDGVAPSCPSAESIAAAVVSALQGTTIPANIKQVNDVTVQGAGTKLNPWQPV